MVRSYLRHEATAAFGVVASNAARALLDADGKTAYVPALEDILVWDIRRGEQLAMWHEVGHRSPVTAITRCPAPTSVNLFAVGYEDGSVRIWDADTSATTLTFHGHKRAVTSLAFDRSGMRLASASQDTTIIVWDLVAETGLYRLKGHRDAITDIAFIYGAVGAGQRVENGSSSASSHILPSTSSAEVDAPAYLLSTSKDGLLKLWDLALQHCVETVVPGKGELWSLAVHPGAQSSSEAAGECLVLTGSGEGEVKAWLIDLGGLGEGLEAIAANGNAGEKLIAPLGTLEVSAKRRVTQIAFGSSASRGPPDFLAVSSSDRSVQVFRMRDEEEMRKKLARRRRRQKEKEQVKSIDSKAKKDAAQGADDDDEGQEVTWLDRIEPYTIIRPETGKLRSFAFAGRSPDTGRTGKAASNGQMSVLCATAANSLEVHLIPTPAKSKAEKKTPGAQEAKLGCSLDLPGHRSEVRALCLSSDDTLLASADSAGSPKIWNVKTGRCIRTMPCGYALTLSWLPGDRYVIVGCKDGSIMTFDVPAGESVEAIKAHDGPVWSIALHPNGLSCVSASADKDVKFWDFEMRIVEGIVAPKATGEDADETARPATGQRQQLALSHVRTLKMTDDVLFARYSPRDGRLLALSLLDNTVKVFYSDSLKFFLSLYGHKLPVLSLDISTDDKLCVTCSADKNVKIWGLDYGDCHRSIFAHQDSIMGVGFERGMQGGGLLGGREGESHHFWTVGKDGLVKHWDGDRFELIQTLEGHHGEVWSLAVGHAGDKLVTSGADRSMRVWEKTEEPLFLEEEREREQERLFEQADREARDREETQVGAVGSLAGEAAAAAAAGGQGPTEEQEATAVTHATSQSLMAGEKLVEALDLADDDRAQRREWVRLGCRGPAPPRNALITASLGEDEDDDDGGDGQALAQRYVLVTLERILPAQLDDALLTLPFDKVVSLLEYLSLFLRRNRQMQGAGSGGGGGGNALPLVSRVLFFLLRQHHAQIVSNAVMRSTLIDVRAHLEAALQRQKATVGYNLAALRHLKAQDISRRTARLYEEGGMTAAGEGGFAALLGQDEAEIRRRVEERGGGVTRKRKANITA